jgi:UDP-N-acetyl-D-mannosaminuronic acid dehydrogenase
MAFKEESDDPRSSLSYKLKRILRFRADSVLCHDPFVRHDPDIRPLEEVIGASDLLIVATPHTDYLKLDPPIPMIDIWSRCEHGELP